MNKNIIHFLLITLLLVSCGKGGKMKDGIFANIHTNKGDIIVKLFYEEAPLTVMNFIGLAEGLIENTVKKGPFYEDIIFHRVVDDFIIQAGDPTGSGYGGPGYSFPDEINENLTHKFEGIFSMANAGANTNGSQFFITLNNTSSHLDSKHTIFGQVVKGMDIVKTIKEGDKIINIKIDKKGTNALKFKVNNEEFLKLNEKKMKQLEEKNKEYMNSQFESLK